MSIKQDINKIVYSKKFQKSIKALLMLKSLLISKTSLISINPSISISFKIDDVDDNQIKKLEKVKIEKIDFYKDYNRLNTGKKHLLHHYSNNDYINAQLNEIKNRFSGKNKVWAYVSLEMLKSTFEIMRKQKFSYFDEYEKLVNKEGKAWIRFDKAAIIKEDINQKEEACAIFAIFPESSTTLNRSGKRTESGRLKVCDYFTVYIPANIALSDLVEVMGTTPLKNGLQS